jgi:hypothetical protein
MRPPLSSLHKDMGPWFRANPQAAVAVAASLFLGISLLRWFSATAAPGDATSVLYVFPIALLALTFGLRGGLIGAVVGFALFAILWTFEPRGVPVLGWVVRGTGMFLMGFLLGRATDQICAHERSSLAHEKRHWELEDENRRYAEATEISDSILQHLVAAKWHVEQERPEEAIEMLTSTIERSQAMVGALLPRKISSRLETFDDEDRGHIAKTPGQGEAARIVR